MKLGLTIDFGRPVEVGTVEAGNSQQLHPRRSKA